MEAKLKSLTYRAFVAGHLWNVTGLKHRRSRGAFVAVSWPRHNGHLIPLRFGQASGSAAGDHVGPDEPVTGKAPIALHA
jgi:hypothetical protein